MFNFIFSNMSRTEQDFKGYPKYEYMMPLNAGAMIKKYKFFILLVTTSKVSDSMIDKKVYYLKSGTLVNLSRLCYKITNKS